MLRSDAVLEHDVAAELAADTVCCGAGIGVTVRHGVVTLTGIVHSAATRTAAICAVKRVFGVDAVDARVEIRSAEAAQPFVAAAGSAPPV